MPGLDEHVSSCVSIDLPFPCLSHMGQEVHEGLPWLLDKVVNVSRGVSRGADLQGLKGKISHLLKVSMKSNSGLNDRVNVCPWPVCMSRVMLTLYSRLILA